MRANAWRNVALVAALVLLLDQLSKQGFQEWLGPGADSNRWELAGRFLAFQYVENRGAAFGILEGQTWILTLLAVAVGIVFLMFMRDLLTERVLPQVGIGLVLGGAVGNLLDRVRLGYVIDFMAVGTWPKFNLADSAITIGLLAIAWSVWNEPEPIADEDERFVDEY